MIGEEQSSIIDAVDHLVIVALSLICPGCGGTDGQAAAGRAARSGEVRCGTRAAPSRCTNAAGTSAA